MTSPENRDRSAWKAGFRTVGGQRCYFRSRWEANYARYLQLVLIPAREIIGWKHEPETFWFDGIRRGVTSYKPDFKLYLNDGSHEWHEVKGMMDHRSIMCIKRMRKFHPAEILHVIDEGPYREIEAKYGHLIPDWEWPGDSMPKDALAKTAGLSTRIRPGQRKPDKSRSGPALERRIR